MNRASPGIAGVEDRLAAAEPPRPQGGGDEVERGVIEAREQPARPQGVEGEDDQRRVRPWRIVRGEAIGAGRAYARARVDQPRGTGRIG